jgi:hypothetical protein
MQVQLQTNDRTHFVRAEDGGGREGEIVHGRPKGLATAAGSDASAWQTFEMRRAPDGRVGFKSPDGGWLSAQKDEPVLVFNRERPEDFVPDGWEAFRVEPGIDGGISLVTDHGTRVRAVNQGGGELRHDQRDAAGIDETFFPSSALVSGGGTAGGGTPTLPTTDLDRIDGQLQVESGGGFIVNGRPVLPILCHYGDGFSRWSRGQQGAVSADLDDIASVGHHGVRFWSTLGLDDHGGGYWAGRAVGPTYTPDYWAHLQAFLEAIRDRGMVCQFSLGDTRRVAVPDLRDYAYRAGDVVNAVGSHVVALGLEVNEDRDTGNQGAAKLSEFNRWFREKCPHVLVGLSAFTGTEDVEVLNDYSRSPANVFVCHGYRGGKWFDKVRHIMSLVYEGKPSKRLGWQGEPAGPGSRVSAIDNRHELDADALCAMAIMSLMTRQAWVYFSGPGVISDEGERLQDMPGFREVPQVRTLLPPDVMRFDQIFHGGETWARQRVFAAQGEVRADHVMANDGRFACLIYGPGGLSVPQTRAATIDKDVTFGNKARLVVGRAA